MVQVKRKRPKRSKWPKGVSETVLQDLWRANVRKDWGGVCAFKDPDCQGSLECHHIKRRSIRVLRYTPINGALVCEYHHGLLKYRYYQRVLEAKVGEDTMEWLDMMERKLLPDFLAERQQTRKEWLAWTKDYLTKMLNGEGGDR